MPDHEEIDDDGIGYFRNVWSLGSVDREYALEIQRLESELIGTADQLAVDSDSFERIASALEHHSLQDLDDQLALRLREAIQPVLGYDESALDGLELGVAGAANALAAAGCIPVASCRAHEGRSWSPWPAVLFATPEREADRVAAVIPENCGLYIDGSRTEFLALGAPDVMSMSKAARCILELA